jgi:hypothetical protein
VRLALDLLDGIRAGQPLGALLGYRFERGLHERGPGLALDRFVAPLRALAPLDDLTAAEHDLADALARQKQIEDTIGALTQQLDALRAADQQAKADLRGRLAAAQAALAAARTTAVTMSGKLQSAQRATPAAASDVSVAALPAALAARIDDVQTQIDAVDDANAQVFDADALVGELSAQLLVEAPTIASLEQAISQLQPELDAARAAVAAAQARRDELAAQRPPVSEALRASNVVDGLALRRRWRAGRDAGRWEADTIPYGAAGLPALASPEGQAIDAELAGLDDAVDAVGDLLMAESVHQLVHGNPLRAGATVDALSRGDAPPPDVEVVRTPRSGTGVSHRLLVLLDPGATADGWPTDTTQVRAVVEPGLEAWTASVLGPAARVRVRARYLGASGETPAEVGLDVLRLSALDAVAMAPAGAGADAGEIEAALLYHLSTERPPGVAADAAVELDRTRDPAWPGEQLSLGEFLELARSVRELLDGARALDGRDLARPGDAADPALDAQDLAARAKLAADALHTARTELASAIADGTGARLGPALVRATRLGIAGTTGAVRGPSDGLARAAAAALAELNARDAARDAADGDIAQVAAVLGDGFRMVPLVAAAGVRDLGASLAASDTLQAGDGLAAVTWLQRAAHVRDGAARLERALLCAEAVGSPERLRLRVGQLPHTADDRWVGLPAAPDQPIAGGRLSLVVQGGPAAMAGAERIAGLVVDEWTEVVPDATQMTGIGFHVDQPDSRAPQAILLAVAPTEDHVWSLDALEATVLETLELARLRLVDLEALGAPALTTAPPPLPLPGAIRPRVVPRLGQYLPAVYLAAAPDDVTVTTDLGRVTAPPS